MEKEVTLPKDILKEVHVKGTKSFQKEVKLIFDKKQAMVRFPTVLTSELDLKEGDRMVVSIDQSSKQNIKIICELKRKK
ncbi:MAG: hypothetical protein KAT28_03755 [Candidatus Aenigmarchaeota archaeon]|nr:hypothetical protein [Candidatus Aenigmarchaeota archaeon]